MGHCRAQNGVNFMIHGWAQLGSVQLGPGLRRYFFYPVWTQYGKDNIFVQKCQAIKILISTPTTTPTLRLAVCVDVTGWVLSGGWVWGWGRG